MTSRFSVSVRIAGSIWKYPSILSCAGGLLPGRKEIWQFFGKTGAAKIAFFLYFSIIKVAGNASAQKQYTRRICGRDAERGKPDASVAGNVAKERKPDTSAAGM